jgi:hypothetical protein
MFALLSLTKLIEILPTFEMNITLQLSQWSAVSGGDGHTPYQQNSEWRLSESPGNTCSSFAKFPWYCRSPHSSIHSILSSVLEEEESKTTTTTRTRMRDSCGLQTSVKLFDFGLCVAGEWDATTWEVYLYLTSRRETERDRGYSRSV